MTNDELIAAAAEVVNRHKSGNTEYGQVASALETYGGEIFRGVCIDVRSSMGFCAEHSAAAAMITTGESRIKRIVAVWKSVDGVVHILPPCGRCREFLSQINEANLETDVILGRSESKALRDLLPYGDLFSTEPPVGRK